MGVTRMPWAPISFSLPIISQKRFWEIIGQLKDLGAQGILVTPIEKMIL